MELTRRRIWGTNTPDAFTGATADATLGLILALIRRIAAGDAYVRSGRWEHEGPQGDRWSGMELGGKTLGIVGFGKIGQAVAHRAEAFGMKIIFHRRGATGDPRQRDLRALLGEADLVTVLVPLTAETRYLIDAEALAAMKAGAMFVNISRGPVVHEQALVDALREGRLAGAALDVFEAEPRSASRVVEDESGRPHLRIWVERPGRPGIKPGSRRLRERGGSHSGRTTSRRTQSSQLNMRFTRSRWTIGSARHTFMRTNDVRFRQPGARPAPAAPLSVFQRPMHWPAEESLPGRQP